MELQRSHRYAVPLAVLMMDLDHFKAVNDTHGHLMGSHVLAEVGRLIRESIRTEDVAARYGGEGVIAYLPGRAADGGRRGARRVRGAVEEGPVTLQGGTIGVN